MNDVNVFAMMLYNSRDSIISTYALVIEASKLNAYAKGHKCIGTIKRFQLYNYKVVA